MSVIILDSSEISDIASSLSKEFGDDIHTYEETQVATQEAQHHHTRHGVNGILSENYRWFWENVSIANQVQGIQRYTKYGQSNEITRNRINVHDTTADLKLDKLHGKLVLVRYNSDGFLTPKFSRKLDWYISMVSERIIRDATKTEA